MNKLTKKQLEILMAVKKGNPAGEPCTIYDILDVIPYPNPTRDSTLHCMRPLIEAGYIEKLGSVKRSGSIQPQMTFGLGPEGMKVI